MLFDQKQTEQHLQVIVKSLFALLTNLICNTAGGLASGLAGSLALAAATCFKGVFQVACAESFNSFHCDNSLMKYNCTI